jgi:hypothetical protein
MLEIAVSVYIKFLDNSYLLARNYQRHTQRALLLVLCQSVLETLAIRSAGNIVFLGIQKLARMIKQSQSNAELTLGSLLIWGTLKVA